jgi:hypothetical protein
LNPDCQADIKDITVEGVGENRVLVKGVKGHPAPETTKVSITALAGYQAEVIVCAVGLDIEEKFGTLKLQIEKSLGKEGLAKFTEFNYTTYGTAKANPETEGEATVMLRIMAQGPFEAFRPNQNLIYIVLCDGLGHFAGLCRPSPWLLTLAHGRRSLEFGYASCCSKSVHGVLASPSAHQAPDRHCAYDGRPDAESGHRSAVRAGHQVDG